MSSKITHLNIRHSDTISKIRIAYSVIEQTAQGILDARALYPDSSLADLYDPLTVPPELRKAHQKNDAAVMQAYGFDVKSMSEADCVAALMKMYQELVSKADGSKA